MEQKQMHKWLQITNSVQKTKSGFAIPVKGIT